MAHLMHEGEHIVQRALEIQEHIGVHARARGIRARALTLVLVHIDPAVCEALAQDGEVILAQRGERPQRDLLGLVEGEFHLHTLDHRNIQVVHVQLVQPEQAAAQRYIAVHGPERAVHRVDQAVVDLRVDLGAVQRGGERRGVFSGVREEQQLLHLRGQGGRRGVAELAVDRIERIERGFAQHAVIGLHERDIGAVGDRVAVAVLVHRVREFEVRVVQHGVDVVRAGGHFARRGEQRLLLVREHMLAAAAHPVKHQPVVFQLGLLGVKPVQGLLVDREQLGGLKRRRGLQLDREPRHLTDHLLIGRYAGVLVAFALGVVYQRVEGQTDLVVQPEERQQGRAALAQTAAVGRDARHIFLRRSERRAPVVVRGEQVVDGPFVLRRHVGARRDLIGLHGNPSFRVCFLFSIMIAYPGEICKRKPAAERRAFARSKPWFRSTHGIARLRRAGSRILH